LVRFVSKLAGASHPSERVLRYEACAPVIGSPSETQSSGSFSVLEFGAGSIFGFTSSLSMGRAALLLVITELRKNRSRNVRGINALTGPRVPAFARYRWSEGVRDRNDVLKTLFL
jgi:hypothetical protein